MNSARLLETQLVWSSEKERQITVPPLTDICEEAVFVFVFASPRADICEEGLTRRKLYGGDLLILG